MHIRPELLKGWGPGGWMFFQPETNWHAPNPLGNTFDQQVKNIVEMRKANPRFNLPTNEAQVAADLEAYTLARWVKIYSTHGLQRFIEGGQEPKKKAPGIGSVITSSASRLFRGVAGLVDVDPASLQEWLGDGGKPVDPSLALVRADACTGCPANQKGGWRELLTVPAAKVLASYLAHKHRLNLATSLDPQLGSCQACHCVLELKVWQPLSYIVETTKPETLAKHLDRNPNCWVIREQK